MMAQTVEDSALMAMLRVGAGVAPPPQRPPRNYARCGACARMKREGWIRLYRDEDGKITGWHHIAEEDI